MEANRERAEGGSDEHWQWGKCYTASAADARLISAAPDLAQVAAWMLGVLEAPLPRAGSPEADDRRQETELACAAARLALAKAEGLSAGGEQGTAKP